MRRQFVLALLGVALLWALPHATAQEPSAGDAAAQLADEVSEKGWLAYGARGAGGSWDLFLSRPDGSAQRNVTNTPDFEEVAPRFSPDGAKLLYRRLAQGTAIDHDRWGFQGELVIADANGANPAVVGEEKGFPWATWSPDGKQLLCLEKQGIYVVDLATKEEVQRLPRKGIYQQIFWSPDGKWVCGTANHMGQSWTVVRMNVESGDMNAARSYQNCTADWFPDSEHIILSSRPADQPGANGYGYTQLWKVSGDGADQQLLYGEDGAHVYGGAASPDGRYVVFTKGPKDGSGAKEGGGRIGVMRLADAPTIESESPDLRKVHPDTKDGPVLYIGTGWEPHWTYAEMGAGE